MGPVVAAERKQERWNGKKDNKNRTFENEARFNNQFDVASHAATRHDPELAHDSSRSDSTTLRSLSMTRSRG